MEKTNEIIMNPDVKIVMTGADLLAVVDYAVNKVLALKSKQSEETDRLMTVNEAVEFFGITRRTLWVWDKRKFTNPIYMAGRKYYSINDIKAAKNMPKRTKKRTNAK
jgi:hypothetical protein